MLHLHHGFRISPLLSEKIGYIGQLDTYEKGSEIARYLLNLSVSDSTIYRLTDHLGEQAEPWLEEDDSRDEIEEEQVVYAQIDGSMILTREAGWKEVKLGRVFGASALCAETDFRNWLKNSEYVAHLGGHKPFEERMSDMLDKYEARASDLVFISDGATVARPGGSGTGSVPVIQRLPRFWIARRPGSIMLCNTLALTFHWLSRKQKNPN